MADHDDTSDAGAADTDLVPTATDRSELPPLRERNAFARFSDAAQARDLILALERDGIDGRYISAFELTGDEGGTDARTDHAAAREEAIDEDVAMAHEVTNDAVKGGAI